MKRIRISGSKIRTEHFLSELQSEADGKWDATEINIATSDPMRRIKLGMDPEIYFIVAFGAHLAADVVIELSKELIRKARERGLSATEHESDDDDES